ncbi:hypothetical protein MASR2M48_20320 [Spirochaetota bacterium]
MPSATAPSRTGYTFGGYYTETLGNGTKYYNSNMSSARNWDQTAADTLYAKWTANTYTVTLNKQNGSGGSSSVTATYAAAMPSATAPAWSGYTFDGYYTSTSGSGTPYYNASMGSVRNWDQAAADTLYAKWTVAVTLDKQSGSGGTSSITAVYGTGMPSASAPSRTGYTFGGYYTGTSGAGDRYYNADMTSAHTWDISNSKLYAKWTANTYTVNLNAQGRAGSTSVSAVYDAAMPSASGPTPRIGEGFSGYYSNSNGSGTQYYTTAMASAHSWDQAFDYEIFASYSAVSYNTTDFYNLRSWDLDSTSTQSESNFAYAIKKSASFPQEPEYTKLYISTISGDMVTIRFVTSSGCGILRLDMLGRRSFMNFQQPPLTIATLACILI